MEAEAEAEIEVGRVVVDNCDTIPCYRHHVVSRVQTSEDDGCRGSCEIRCDMFGVTFSVCARTPVLGYVPWYLWCTSSPYGICVPTVQAARQPEVQVVVKC